MWIDAQMAFDGKSWTLESLNARMIASIPLIPEAVTVPMACDGSLQLTRAGFGTFYAILYNILISKPVSSSITWNRDG